MRCSFLMRIGLISLALVKINFHLSAQLLINKNQAITVNGVNLFVGGSAVNSGTLTNNGIMTVTGDWTNTNKYNSGTGSFILKANSIQNISHNGDSFFKLSLQGTGKKVLAGDAFVIDNLDFSQSPLTTQGAAIIVKEGGTISNYSSTAFIDGVLFLEGTGKKFFPIGKGTSYLPVTLENVAGGATLPIIGMEAFDSNTGATASTELNSVSGLRYWSLTERGTPSFTGSTITLPIQSDENITSTSEAVVASSLTQNGPYVSFGQSAVTTSGQSFVTSSLSTPGRFYAIGILNTDKESLFIPSALSPVATDDRDKTIKLLGTIELISPSDFDFTISGKLGVIFQTNSLTEMTTTGWTGIDTATKDFAANGTYTFSCRGRLNNGRVFQKTGVITMIR